MAKQYGQIDKNDLGYTFSDNLEHYTYCGLRNFLHPVAWQYPEDEFFRRHTFIVWPRLTVAAGSSLDITIVKYGGAQDTVTYSGPLANQTATPALLALLGNTTDGCAVSGCEPVVNIGEHPEGTAFKIIAKGDGRDPYTIHGLLVQVICDQTYTGSYNTADCDCVEHCDRQGSLLPYEFADAWSGQAGMAHTLDRYCYEAVPIFYVPMFSYILPT